jgi:hypothetical protein
MANRHSHKKLRVQIRARMARTGESYQRARDHLLASERSDTPPRTDLVPFSYFGIPATLATIEDRGLTVFSVLPSSTLWQKGYPHPLPISLLRTALRPRGVQ